MADETTCKMGGGSGGGSGSDGAASAAGATGVGASGAGPGFDRPVGPGGYAWWYLDGLSAEGHAITIIAFIGSVFSPWYSWAGRRDPENHVAMNVALYGPRARWCMTERGRGALARSAAELTIGRSAMRWDGTGLTVEIDERAVPHLGRVRGRVRIRPEAEVSFAHAIDGQGAHLWRPLAPLARIEVDFPAPGIRWQGAGYLDMNTGSRMLEEDFAFWTWSRTVRQGGEAAILYDTRMRDGREASLALRIGRGGGVTEAEPPPPARLPRTLWRMPRPARADAGALPRVIRRMEDAPFYSRTAFATRLWGEDAEGVHESLDLGRYDTRWCRTLLPFRMPRRP